MLKKFNSGVLRILNLQINKAYYHACRDLNRNILKQKKLLDEGKHRNLTLQRDYSAQNGFEFSFEIIEKGIDFKTAEEIEEIWIESDKTAYNNMEER